MTKVPVQATHGDVMAISSHGEWFVIAEGTSLLVYPCRR